MTGPLGVDLQGLDPLLGDPFGIKTALDVALDDPDTNTFLQTFDGLFQEAGLSGAGTGHEIDDEQTISIEDFPVLLGHSFVDFQDVPNYRDLGHIITSSNRGFIHHFDGFDG